MRLEFSVRPNMFIIYRDHLYHVCTLEGSEPFSPHLETGGMIMCKNKEEMRCYECNSKYPLTNLWLVLRRKMRPGWRLDMKR
jgi:hypothetical protein